MTLEKLQKNRTGLLTMYMRDAYEKAKEIIASIPEDVMQAIFDLSTFENPIARIEIEVYKEYRRCSIGFAQELEEEEIPDELKGLLDEGGFNVEKFVGELELNEVTYCVTIGLESKCVEIFFSNKVLKYIEPKVLIKEYGDEYGDGYKGYFYMDYDDIREGREEEEKIRELCETTFGEFYQGFYSDDRFTVLTIDQKFFD